MMLLITGLIFPHGEFTEVYIFPIFRNVISFQGEVAVLTIISNIKLVHGVICAFRYYW